MIQLHVSGSRFDPCERQPHKLHLTSKLNSKTFPVYLPFDPSHIFPFHPLPSPVHPTRSLIFPWCIEQQHVSVE